ncbi:hypothetical protein B0A48_07899 [Cryoendolithus antarcticus]|uniref:Formamidopyrimidine-DNA glycosylase catalytic domain-containing protein n=1 Tax=Cryoendolithus antarcticus TaxID=1507870 RepID=A0A1V8T139_9PEZI|nr:hypothetical protein B0A48_07899 [Cryoendolithus antarcticus]
MPEIGEVARIVNYLCKHLLNRTISSCTAYTDEIVYGKVGCSAEAFQGHTADRLVTNVAQQGKYFYLTFDKPPHAVLHLGMTGWMKFSTDDSRYYKQGKDKGLEEEWPPKYVKFLWKVEKEVGGEGREEVEVAFVDPRRLARIRLVECEAGEIRKTSPLKENGPDPVVDKEVFTVEFLSKLLRRKRVPVKALLLDQANISGVGNWVADEVLYMARLHPEQYSNTFDDEQIKRLHDSMVNVCTLAVDTLSDSSKFPETWLMKHRWNKGKKDSNVLPNGAKITHVTVGGRTSAIVPSVQKKTAAVAGDVKSDDEAAVKPTKGRKRKATSPDHNDEVKAEQADTKPTKTRKGNAEKTSSGEADAAKTTERPSRSKKAKTSYVEPDGEAEEEKVAVPTKAAAKRKSRKLTATKVEPETEDANGGAEQTAPDGVDKAKPESKTPKRLVKTEIPGERRSGRKSAGDLAIELQETKARAKAAKNKPAADAIPGERQSMRTKLK